MTTVGKILVFLVLVCSLAVGAFAVMDFTARTHWADQYDKLSKKYQVVEASRNTYKAEADKLSNTVQSINAQLKAKVGEELKIEDVDQAATRTIQALAAKTDQIMKLKNELTDVRRQLATEKLKVTNYDNVAKVSQLETVRRQADVERMRDTLKTEVAKNLQLIKDMNELRDRAVGAEIERTAFKETNKKLESELQDMARTMTRMRLNSGNAGGAARAGLNPPPDNVEGLIRRADGNLVTITIGSDAGLMRGHTMEVFRLGQNPRYIGRIKIVEVTPTQAVGQAAGRMGAAMQVGDRVASRIMGGN